MKRPAFTVVELLVAVAISGLLIALLLPALQAARESSRRSQCANNLKQISLALINFNDQQGHFPLGGWGHQWVGVADRGFSKRQPGGWIYSLLPYVESDALHRRGARSTGQEDQSLLEHSLPLFTCPTRRPAMAWPVSEKFPYMLNPKPFGISEFVGRSDYAINGGATKAQSFKGPDSLEKGDAGNFSWPTPAGIVGQPDTAFSGISHIRMAAKLKNIEDGNSWTYLAGEKYLHPAQYENGESHGDNESAYSGFCSDNHRFTEWDLTPAYDGSLPIEDLRSHFRFGSAHANGLNLAYCDGSVHYISYEIQAEAHHRAGHTSDQGTTVDAH